MKTTINIPDALFRETKKIAEENGTTFKAVVESALRLLLRSKRKTQKHFTLKTHTFQGEGLQDGLKEGDWSQFLSRSYEGRGG